MESINSQAKLEAKCTYVTVCIECGYKKCYDFLSQAQSGTLKHSIQMSHIPVGAYELKSGAYELKSIGRDNIFHHILKIIGIKDAQIRLHAIIYCPHCDTVIGWKVRHEDRLRTSGTYVRAWTDDEREELK